HLHGPDDTPAGADADAVAAAHADADVGEAEVTRYPRCVARLGDRLERRARETLVGRGAELARPVGVAVRRGPPAPHLPGLPGIGKTQLLHALAERLRDEAPDVAIVAVDAGEVEPSPAALCAFLAPGAADPADAARAVTAAGRRVLLVVDRYETFRLLD